MPTVAADFVVIGAGIAGAAVAWRLAPRGRVVLLEAEHRPGYHSTGRSAAMFCRAYGTETVRALTAASHDFFLDASELGLDGPLLSPRGALHVARADQRAALEREYAVVSAHVPEARLADAAFAREKAPILRESAVDRCLWDPSSADIDIARMHDAMLAQARRRGCQFVRSAHVERIERDGGTWRIVAGADRFEAPAIVNAAGAWADEIATLAGVGALGLQPRRRTIAVVQLPETVDPRHWPLTIDVDERWYFKGEAGRLLVSPADETAVAPCDASVDDQVLAEGIARFEAATTVEVRRVTSAWAGLRSFFADRSPVLGADPRVQGFHWCAGLGGSGIQTAPAASALVAAAVLGEPAAQPDLVAPTSAARLLR